MSEPRAPYLRVTWTDPVTGRKGYMVIDRLIDGIAGGGTRMRAGLDLQEVERLAHTVSIKNGAIKLPGGGAKGGLAVLNLTLALALAAARTLGFSGVWLGFVVALNGVA